MPKKISIITININNSVGLIKTIESVVSQSFKDFEYIVIDGASDDGSIDIIKQYSDKIAYWISEQDNGIYNAMNKGILQAQGKYCLFLNSGDTLYDRDVLQYIFSQNSTAEIINGDMLRVYPNGILELDKGQAFSRKQQNKELTLYDMFIGTINHSSSFIKKDLFGIYGLYDENFKIVSDWLFFLKVVGLNGIKVEYVDCIVSKFDMTGISNSNQELLIKERQEALMNTIPKHIFEDYKFFNEIYCSHIVLQEKYNYLFHYRLTRAITKFANKLFRLLDSRQGKNTK